MNADRKRDVIEVWRLDDLAELEVRRGFSVARPVPRHWHEEYQLCLIQAGSGDLMYRGSSFTTPPASLFIVHPGEVHSNRAFDSLGVSYRMLFVDAEPMRRAAAEVRGRESGLPFFPEAVVFDRDLIGRYLRLHSALERPSSALERQTLLVGLLTELVARFAEHPASPRPCGPERRGVGRALEYLSAHYAENVPLESLARVANLSPYHFSRVFSEQCGMPPHAFQTQLRVSRAKALLRQGRRPAEAASDAGFADQSHLTRHFKRLFGVTPGQYARGSKNVQD